MTKDQFSQAFALAKSEVDLPTDDLEVFSGFGLSDFRPVTVTIQAVAALVRWQSFHLFGGIDNDALNEVAQHGRRKFLICG